MWSPIFKQVATYTLPSASVHGIHPWSSVFSPSPVGLKDGALSASPNCSGIGIGGGIPGGPKSDGVSLVTYSFAALCCRSCDKKARLADSHLATCT